MNHQTLHIGKENSGMVPAGDKAHPSHRGAALLDSVTNLSAISALCA